MREPLDRNKLTRFLEALGAAATGPGVVFLTGGATAVAHGWRSQTIDIDLRLDPEPAGAFDAIAKLKETLDVNVELASPADFLPPVPGWRDRSIFVGHFGAIDVYHFDLVSQTLAKLARGFTRDHFDADAMVASGLVDASAVESGFAAIRPGLVRFPRLDEPAFAQRVAQFIARHLGVPP